jgi:hypothetical protein
MIKRIALLVIILSLSLATPVLAAESDGVISGQVINGTEDGGSVADLDITLETHLGDAEPIVTNSKTDAEGRFIFEGLNTDPVYGYHAKIEYQQAEYDGGHIAFAEGETAKTAEVWIYDSTTSAEAIIVAMAHTVIYVSEESLQVTEYFMFINQGDRTYIGSVEVTTDGQKETIRLPLPSDATEIQLGSQLMDCCIVAGEDCIIDTMPVLPGYKEMAYSYQVSHSSSEYTIARTMDYPTNSYELLVQGSGVTVSSEQMEAQEPLTIEGATYEYLSAVGLVPGDTLAIQLTGLPRDESQQVLLWVMGALLVLGSVFGYTMRRRKTQPAGATSPERQKQQLLADIARLDDDYEAGRITEESYRQQRVGKKGRLTKLMQGPRGQGGSRDG